MIDLSLDCHDFVAAVEGFARGSHLRQHVWRDIVFRNIPQMTDNEMDFFWDIFRRNLWDCYFSEINGRIIKHCGHEDYLHALAALHRGNRYKVTFLLANLTHSVTIECYRFAGRYRPLCAPSHLSNLSLFDAYIPEEWVTEKLKRDMPYNRYVVQGKEQWWTDLSIYNDEMLL